MDYHDRQIKHVRSKDRITYHCSQCGKCCTHTKNSIMLESLDAYRIAGFLNRNGENFYGTEDVYNRYCIPMPLTEKGYPVFLLDTCGPEDSCVFFKEGRCSIYPVRPRTCRLYPFTVAPGTKGKDFEYFLCTDRPHHLSGGKISVKDWLYQNFRQEDKDFVIREFQYAAEIGRLMAQIDSGKQEQAVFLLLFFLYYDYDIREPFMSQYGNNHRQLLEHLNTLVGARKGGLYESSR